MNSPLTDELKKKFEKISHLILDVDGVLTDGRIIMDDKGQELKQFDVKDGHGLKMLLRSGFQIMFLTGRTSRVVAQRAQDLGIKDVYQGAKNKVKIFEDILQAKGISPRTVAYMGDDIVDVPLFKRVGLSIAVANACHEALKAADYVTEKEGGRGAVREVCDMILHLQGKWAEVILQYELS
jgi:3-deoxy-D-manno-octulosonate 8-phosphate phosphatase (KDO 8-P phosphatase)